MADGVILVQVFNVWDCKKFCTAWFDVRKKEVLFSKDWPDVALLLSFISISEPRLIEKVSLKELKFDSGIL